MLTRCARALIGGASALGVGLLVALPGATPASASGPVPVPTFRPGHALLDVGVQSKISQAQAIAAAASQSTFPQYKATVKVGTKTYTYVMAGKNPAIKVTDPSSTITADLVPVTVNFTGTSKSWDPAKTDSCDPGASALARVQKSPIEVSQPWKWGGTPVGTGQLTDAFQRASFWRYARPGGINPKFGISLAWKTLKPVTINVPSADAATAAIGCGNGLLGAVDINWLDSYLQKTVIPSLKSQGVGISGFPVFLLHNVVEYIGTAAQCCVLGYHNAYTVTGGIQTYGLATYDNSRAFTGMADITALSHEVAEWQNDPYTNNPTPAWGHIGQASGCQSNLEVGDPLTGTTFTDTAGGFTYHPQEQAFASWFYHQTPSPGVNGWYSNQGTFTASAGVCAPYSPGTTLHGVSARTPADVWAVGSHVTSGGGTRSVILHEDGSQWAQVPSPDPGGTSVTSTNSLYGVSTASATDAWAVGSYSSSGHPDRSLILHWNGTRWAQVPSPSPGGTSGTYLSGVSAVSPADAWAAGSYTASGGMAKSLILHWDGTRWAQVTSPSPSTLGNGLLGVSAVSATDAWAAGYYNGTDDNGPLAEPMMLHWNGTKWTQATVPAPAGYGYGALNGVSAVSPAEAWAAGIAACPDNTCQQASLIMHWDGTGWT